jgi:peptidyl-prolyl cis-trans isomerase D
MIRFLQRDNRVIKGVFIAIIAVACITMVITLVPGIFSDAATTGNTYASIRSAGYFGRVFGPSRDITTPEVQQVAQRLLQQQKLPDFALPYVMPRAAQALIQREILMQEADHMGLQVTDNDLRYELQNGPFAPYLFPKGQFIGDDGYANFVQSAFGMSKEDFEKQFKEELAIQRLETLITGSVFVSDKEVRDAYMQQGTKVKFQYAVLTADDLRKEINPSDADLQTFFKQNAARYKDADPETRKIAYIAFTPDQVPGGNPQVSDTAIQAYYNAHLKDYQVQDQVKVRHILIKVPAGSDAKADGEAKAKAEDVLKQLHAGANFADLAKKYSDDPGSKEQGGELGFIQHGQTVPEFDKTAFALNPGQTSDLVKTQFGYHIIQSEEKQTAHTKSLAEVKPQIEETLANQLRAQQEQNYAASLAAQAKSSGLQKTAAAHNLQVVTTDYIPAGGVIAGLPDGSKLLTQAFTAKPNDAPMTASTGEGYAVFQVLDVKAAHAPTFDEYKARLLEDFRDQQLPQLIARKTSDLAAAAHADNDLEKAAKEFGATVKTSDLVGRDAQVPDIGQLAQAAPQVFNLSVNQISGAIDTERSGVVIKLLDKQSPSADDIAKNFEQTKQQMLSQRREEAFEVFVTSLTDKYQKQGRIRMNNKAAQGGLPQRLPS